MVVVGGEIQYPALSLSEDKMLEAYEKDDGRLTPGMGLSLRVCCLEVLERAPSLGKLPGGGDSE